MDKVRLNEWENFHEKLNRENKTDSEKIQYLGCYVKELLFRVLTLESKMK